MTIPMTEAAWLSSTDPSAMLAALGRNEISARKARLVEVAICRTILLSRRMLSLDAREAILNVTERAEWIADSGKTTEDATAEMQSRYQEYAVSYLLNADSRESLAIFVAGHFDSMAEKTAICAIVRDIVGNPHRPFVSTFGRGFIYGVNALPSKHEWLTWSNGTVPRMAEAIYQERRYDELPVLADALEEAGCDNNDILMHCRGLEPCLSCHLPNMEFGGGGGNYWCPQCGGTQDMHCGDGWMKLRGAHVRGCWVLDLLTGRA